MQKRESRIIWLVSIGLLMILLLPYALLGQEVFILAKEVLNTDFIYLHLLKTNKLLFHWAPERPISHIHEGIANSYLVNHFSFLRGLFFLFSSFFSCMINLIIVRMVAFIGTYLLCRDYFKGNTLVNLLLALIFSLLPLSTLSGLSILGQPLLIWAFLNLQKSQLQKTSWYIILIFPFYSEIFPAGLAFMLGLLFYGLYRLILSKKVGEQFFPAIFISCILYAMSHYPMIYSIIMHRKTSYLEYLHPIDALGWEVFWIFVPIICLLLIIFSIQKAQNQNSQMIISVLLVICLITVGVINREISDNSKRLLGLKNTHPSFHEFFNPSLLLSLKAYVARPLDTYKVMSLGIPSSVLHYNGFYTLNADLNSYPFSYRDRIEEITFAGDETDHLYEKNCCNVVPNELKNTCGNDCHKHLEQAIENLELATSSLRDLKVDYIVSSVEIKNSEEIGLTFERMFSRADSYWDIYLYSLKP